MSRTTKSIITSAAYRLAWVAYNSTPNLSKKERVAGWKKLKTYIDVLAAIETDAEQIASSALLLMRFESGSARPSYYTEGARAWA